MNVRDMVTDVGISIDACNLLRHFVAVASVRDDTAKSVDDVSCCVCDITTWNNDICIGCDNDGDTENDDGNTADGQIITLGFVIVFSAGTLGPS